MIKKIVKILLIISLILVLAFLYLSIFGIKTTKLNNQIKNQILKTNKGISLDLKSTKITISPLDLKVNIITLDTTILFNNKKIKLESLKTTIPLLELFKKKFSVGNLQIRSRSIKIKNLVSLIRYLKNDPKLLFLEMKVEDGYLEVSINLNFDKKGKVKNDFRIDGVVKNLNVKTIKNYDLDNLNFIFNIRDKKFKFIDIEAQFNRVKLNSPLITIKEKNNSFFIDGKILNKEKDISFDKIQDALNNYYVNLNLKDIHFVSDNFFSFEISKKFKLSNLNINSEINLSKLTYKNDFESVNKYFPKIKELIKLKNHKIKFIYNKDKTKITGSGKILVEDSEDKISYEITKKNKGEAFKFSDLNINSEINLSKLTYKNNFKFIYKYFPEIKELIKLKNHKIKFIYNKDKTKITGSGKILVEDSEDKISYEITKKNKQYYFKNVFETKQIILIDKLQYEKKNNKKALIKVEGNLDKNRSVFFNKISFFEKNNSILIKNLNLNNKLKISNIGFLEINYINDNKIRNHIYIKKNKKNYIIEGNSFDASEIINIVMNNEDNNNSIFDNLNSNIILNIKKTYIDNINFINNISGNINYKNNKINDLKLESTFLNKKKIKLSIENNKNNEKVTTFFTGYPKPLVKRYKFIRGFEGGYLDFQSIKKNGVSNSLLIIDNFKVKQVPVLAKLLSLASLQGIADLLTGEGIRFTDFEMKFQNKKGLMTIDEMYSIGPAVSVLMSGYIEDKKLVSLRGTLVPATTINRSISSIPLLGKILIGDKVGEGVFGVSFKIKGPLKNLKTTVNPIKSLTPRFITRTLEKIKKN